MRTIKKIKNGRRKRATYILTTKLVILILKNVFKGCLRWALSKNMVFYLS